MVSQAVWLGSDAVRIVRDDGVLVFFSQLDQGTLHVVELFGHGHEMFSLFHDADGRQHILGRTAGMDLRDFRACCLDEVWFESDDIRRTRAARLVSFIKDLLDAMGNVLAFSRGQEPFIGIDDIRSFIDLAEPVKVVSGCLVSSKMIEPDISAQSVSAINDFS